MKRAALLLLLTGAAPTWGPDSQTLALAEMSMTWAVVGDEVHATLTAPTSGWVLVGLHDREALDGARLAMAALTPSGPVVEEHVARPPRHAARSSGARARLVHADEAGPETRITVAVPLDPLDPTLPTLVAGQPVWVWLAWSHDPDFQHHSARREGAWITL